ncbi:MAG: hypothetical protein AB1510_06750 [Bacillota bacterium]
MKRSAKLSLVSLAAALIVVAGGFFLVYVFRPPGPQSGSLSAVATRPFEKIISESEAALIGEVTDISETKLASEGNKWHEDALGYREVTIKADRFLNNSIGLSDEVKIIVLGGEMKVPLTVALKKGSPSLVRHWGEEASFYRGEKVLVFLKRGLIGYKKASGEEARMDRLGLVGAYQGKFRIEGNNAINECPELSRTVSDIENLVKEVK